MNNMAWRKASRLLKYWRVILYLLPVSFLATGQCQAAPGNAGAKYTMNISMDGTIVANGKCTFNRHDNLTVDFGEVSLLAGANNTVTLEGDYRRPIVSDFKCSGDSAGLLQMQLSNSGGTYKDYKGVQVLDVDKGIVGVELLVNGSAQNMGTWFNINPDSPPSLEAQLVQTSTTNSSSVVSGDTFTASGTLTMAFN